MHVTSRIGFDGMWPEMAAYIAATMLKISVKAAVRERHGICAEPAGRDPCGDSPALTG